MSPKTKLLHAKLSFITNTHEKHIFPTFVKKRGWVWFRKA
jgi:hypothetical protein